MVLSFHPQVKHEAAFSHPPRAVEAPVAARAKVSPVQYSAPQTKVEVKPAHQLVTKVLQVNHPQQLEYVVEPGDRLDKISMKFYETHHRHGEILKANPGLDPRRMKPGQKLIIPNIREGLPMQDSVYLQRVQPKSRPYEVKSGEVLSIIAVEQLGSQSQISKILELNPGLQPDRLKPGQVIQLPISP